MRTELENEKEKLPKLMCDDRRSDSCKNCRLCRRKTERISENLSERLQKEIEISAWFIILAL